MARRIGIPEIFFRPVIERGKSEAQVRALLLARWHALAVHLGIPPSVLLHNAKTETLIDAILRDPAASRTMLCFLAWAAFPGFRVIEARTLPRRDNIPLCLRYMELREKRPRVSKAAIARDLLKQKPRRPELRGLGDVKAVVNAITDGQRQLSERAASMAARRRMTSLLAGMI